MLKSYEYRIYPNKTQQVLLAKHFGCVRLVYNKSLELCKQSYKENNKIIPCFQLCKLLTQWKHNEELNFLKEPATPCLQQTIRHLDLAYKNFFKIIKENGGKIKIKDKSLEKKRKDPSYEFTEKDIEGLPRFKSKKSKKQSYSVPESCYVDFDKKQVRFPKFQEGVKARIDRTFEGTIKTCTIKKSNTGKYFISVLVEDGKAYPMKKPINKDSSVGVDFGIKSLAIVSNGEIVENTKFLRNSEKRLKKLQREASRKVKGSNRQKKAYRRVALLNEKIRFQRNDYTNKFSSRIIYDDQIDTICLEDLNVKGMVKNHKLAKSISDASWSKITTQLQQKAESVGKNILFVDRFYPSSKTCNHCGYINKDLTLNDRDWTCPVCGKLLDRDFNAALNIRDEALRNYFTGQGMPDGLAEPPALAGTMKREQNLLKSMNKV